MSDELDELKELKELKDQQLEQIFDEDKLKRALKKGKRKSTKRMVIISLLAALLVFVLISVGNIALTITMSNKAFQRMNAYIRLTVPGGYIRNSVDTLGFLGGNSYFTVSRMIGNKPVTLEERVQPFGLITQFMLITRGQGGGSASEDWPMNYWEYGYDRMIFFHPQIAYKDYKNDLANLTKVGDDKLIEVGLSLDKPYTVSELAKILPDANISWCWIDAFTQEDMKRYETEAKEYDAKASFISESEVLGVDLIGSRGTENFASDYNNFLYTLKISQNQTFLNIYDNIKAKGYTDSAKVPILGVIVYGTKDQLKPLIGNPHIKASSFGVLTENY